jgi:hypothetical protein
MRVEALKQQSGAREVAAGRDTWGRAWSGSGLDSNVEANGWGTAREGVATGRCLLWGLIGSGRRCC